jgi:hypothetical protein
MHPIYNERRSGKSTLIAVHLLGEAMKKPYTWYGIQDHHPTVMASANLGNMIQDIIDKLGWEGFLFKEERDKFFIMFTGFKNDKSICDVPAVVRPGLEDQEGSKTRRPSE